jgi:hypothetical protein
MVEEAALRGLKTAFRALIDAVGGFDPASLVLKFPVSKLSEAASLHRMDRAPRIDHVAVLEALVGEPLVTAQLARLSGHALLPQQAAPAAPAPLLARVLREAGELGGVTAETLADGRVTQAERDALVAGLDELILSAQRARAAVAPTLHLVGGSRAGAA